MYNLLHHLQYISAFDSACNSANLACSKLLAMYQAKRKQTDIEQRGNYLLGCRGGCAHIIDCITCAIDLYARPRNPFNPLIQHFVKSAHWLCRGYESSPEYTLRHTHYRGIVKSCRALTPAKAVSFCCYST